MRARRVLVAAAVVLAGCGGGAQTVQPPPAQTVNGSGVRAVEVASGLDRPVYVAFAPGETVPVAVSQAGLVTVLADGGPRLLLDLSARVLTSPKGAFASEQGLLSIAFAPDYRAGDGRIWADFTDREGRVNVVEYTVRHGLADPSTERRLLLAPKRTDKHHGGQLQLGPDGLLYVSVGDDRSIPSLAQDPDGPYGAILRIDPDAPEPARWEVVAYGLRNPWRFSFDRETGDLWIGDVGESGWEEVDVLRRGQEFANLGWDAFEGFEEYAWEGRAHRDPSGAGELVWPAAVYSHDDGCSVTGGYVYHGDAVPGLRGRYVYGDYCTGTVWSVDAADPGEVRRELELGTTLASFGEDGAGELYLVSRTGRLFRLAAG